MYIVGTSGHIDHGKTSLIRMLTDIDCDRLPEEKKREMTIDIGFANIEYPRFGTVSIIDVPGHERFIRNMVVGAWGIDLALLVVAADDGWMPQTEDHFRVLQLLGIERIIAVLNKTDLADDEMIEFAEEEIREKMTDTPYHECDIVRVSSKTGAGIEKLRELIVVNLRKLTKAVNAGKPYLFVDRNFAAKGHGTVITGTLKNGVFKEEDEVTVLPGTEKARIKRIESHYNTLNETALSQRTALNLSGISLEDIDRGSIVVRDNFFTMSDTVLVKIQLLRKRKIKNNLGIEILIGTTALKGKIILMEETGEKEIFPARICFETPWFFYPGQPFIVTNPGGFRIVGGGSVLLPDYSSMLKKRIKENVGNFTSYSFEEILKFIIEVHACIKRERVENMFPRNKKQMGRSIEALKEEGVVHEKGEFILTEKFHYESVDKMGKAILEGTGLNLKELSDIVKTSVDVCRLLVPEVLKNFTVFEKEGRFFSGDSATEENLPDDRRNALDELKAKGTEGIELDKMKDDKKKKAVRDLVKLGFSVSLDGNIVYHREIYEQCTEKVMTLFDALDRITMADVKAVTNLSRKYSIPLLNRMENDNLIRRLGDFRIKV